MPKADRVVITPRTTASEFHLAVNRIRLSQMIRDPVVAAAFRAEAAEDDNRVAPPSQRQPTKPTSIRALAIFDSLPRNHRTLLIEDDASAPHLKAGECAVIDTTDRELQAGELYVIRYDSGDRRRYIVQIRSTASGWWAGDLAGYRQTNAKIFGVPVLAGVSDGPYTPGLLKKKLLGRVVGYAETALGGLLLDK